MPAMTRREAERRGAIDNIILTLLPALTLIALAGGWLLAELSR